MRPVGISRNFARSHACLRKGGLSQSIERRKLPNPISSRAGCAAPRRSFSAPPRRTCSQGNVTSRRTLSSATCTLPATTWPNALTLKSSRSPDQTSSTFCKRRAPPPDFRGDSLPAVLQEIDEDHQPAAAGAALWHRPCQALRLISARLASPQPVSASTKEKRECQPGHKPADMRHIGNRALVGRFAPCGDRAKAAEKLQHDP
jgi:hypothetical protein